MPTREEEVARLLEASRRRSSTSIETTLSRELSRTWEAVMTAHDRTTKASKPLRDNGLIRDFYLLALDDLADAHAQLEDGMSRLSRLLVEDLNVARSTVAEQAHVSRTKMNRWLDDA